MFHVGHILFFGLQPIGVGKIIDTLYKVVTMKMIIFKRMSFIVYVLHHDDETKHDDALQVDAAVDKADCKIDGFPPEIHRFFSRSRHRSFRPAEDHHASVRDCDAEVCDMEHICL